MRLRRTYSDENSHPAVLGSRCYFHDRETFLNIGFVIILAEIKTLARAQSYAEIREMALAAEALDFDAVWLYDHLLYRPEDQPTIGIWECWTMLSALAEATRRVELGSLVLCNAFRNPAILAKMAHTLDEVSGGRFILGVGAGWNEPEFAARSVGPGRLIKLLRQGERLGPGTLGQRWVEVFVGFTFDDQHAQAKPFVATDQRLVEVFAQALRHLRNCQLRRSATARDHGAHLISLRLLRQRLSGRLHGEHHRRRGSDDGDEESCVCHQRLYSKVR